MLFLALLFGFFGSSLGWWQMGHYVVAQIASNQLTASERLNVDTAVVGGGELFGFAPNLVESAAWMDDLKVMGLNAFNAWHYTNTPVVFDNFVPPPGSDVNLTWALQDMLLSYKTTRATAGSRAFALRALVHLVGDMGQPMHSATLFSAAFPKGDQGGNLFKVNYRGMSTNLHTVFDSCGFRLNDTLAQPMTSAQALSVQAVADDATRLFPRSSFSDSDVLFNPTGWANTGYALAVKYAYLNGTLAVGSNLSDEYMDNVYTMCLKMLALSGYRLQFVLQRWQMPLAPGDEEKPWILIVTVSTLGALVTGIVSGSFGLWLLQKRRKRKRYLSSISHDSEDDLIFQKPGQDAI